METVVEFSNTDMQRLVGILHVPTQDDSSRKTGVIMINSGLEDKVGVHRLYVKVARRLCMEGKYVLRFDGHGVGDSEGELAQVSKVEKYLSIENGIFVNDALCALEFIRKRIKLDRIFLLGLCGGGVTSMLAASRDCRIDGLILLATPVCLEALELEGKINPLEAHERMSTWRKKLSSFKTWYKFFTLRMDYSYLFKMINVHILHSLKSGPACNEEIGRPLNQRFVEAFLVYTSNRGRVLFCFPENDLITTEFRHKFGRYISGLAESVCEVLTFKNSNHEFHSIDAQRNLMDTISKWLGPS